MPTNPILNRLETFFSSYEEEIPEFRRIPVKVPERVEMGMRQ